MKSIQLILTTAILLTQVLSTPVAEPEPEPANDMSSGNSTEDLLRRAGGYFIAFDDGDCRYNAGDMAQINYDDKCIPTASRHSFWVGGCRQHVTIISSDTLCWGRTEASYDVNPDTCINVNTGTNWQSSVVRCV